MGMRPFSNGSGNATLLVNEVLGDAYIVVKRVDDHITAIQTIDTNMAALVSLEGSMPSITPLLENASSIGVVGESIGDVVEVAANMLAVTGAAANAATAQAAATTATNKAAEASANAATVLADKNTAVAAAASAVAARDNAIAADASSAANAQSAAASAQLAAEFVANGGVASFNDRTGLVTSQTGDYTADQITETTGRKFATEAALTKVGHLTVTGPVDLDTVSSKANSASQPGHVHTIDNVTGLSIALAGKMPSTRTFTLAEMTDVINMAGASDGFVMVKSGSTIVFQAAPWALADHEHTYAIADITGLVAALAAKKDVASEWYGTQAAYDAIGTKDPNVTYFIYAS